MENTYIIDWLSFTCKSTKPLNVISDVGLKELNFTNVVGGRYGYDSKYTLDCLINVYYSMTMSDMGVHV